MLRTTEKVCYTPDFNEKPIMFLNQTTVGVGGGGGNKKRVTGTWTFRFQKDPKFSPVRFLQQLGAKVGSVIVLVFILVFHFAPRCGHTNVLVFTGICSLMGSLSVSKLIYCYLSCNVSLMIDLNFKVLLTQSYQV